MKRNILLAAVILVLAFSRGLRAQFVQERAIRENESEIEEQQIQLEVYDASTREGIHADILVKGLNPRQTVTLSNISDTLITINQYRLYTVSCIKPGYMYYARKFWPDEMELHVQPVPLEPLRVGLKTSIEDITFAGNETQIYHKSAPALEELMNFLLVNPTVSICIIGHVNGPDNDHSESFYRKASERRAAAVRDYLIQHGIKLKRLSTRGAGNSEMIYRDPKTDWETQANRRIEIEITGL